MYDYDPYGNPTTVTGTATSDIGYAGYFYHPASGLEFALYRAYDPTHARWLNRDPIAEAGGINLYGYTQENPITLVDPSGLLSTDECVQILEEIATQVEVIDELDTMVANYQDGQTFADYGLAPQADVTGYRSDSFSQESQTFQNVVNEMESNWGFTAGIMASRGVIGLAGYYTLGLHGWIHDTTAQAQWVQTVAATEMLRSVYVVNGLEKAYDEGCKCDQ